MLNFVQKHASEYSSVYGNIATASVGAIQRAILTLENEGADHFFGEPSFDIQDLLACEGGKGVMSALAADKLMMKPKLIPHSSFGCCRSYIQHFRRSVTSIFRSWCSSSTRRTSSLTTRRRPWQTRLNRS